MPFLGFLALLAFIPLSIILDGYTLAILWKWFVVKQFGLAPLTIPVALGLATLARYIIRPAPDQTDEDDSLGVKIATSAAYTILRPAAALLFGWIVLLFM